MDPSCPDLTFVRWLAASGWIAGCVAVLAVLVLWWRSDSRRDALEDETQRRLDFYRDMAKFNGIHTQKTQVYKP